MTLLHFGVLFTRGFYLNHREDLEGVVGHEGVKFPSECGIG